VTLAKVTASWCHMGLNDIVFAMVEGEAGCGGASGRRRAGTADTSRLERPQKA
jgi:hypothetical protein